MFGFLKNFLLNYLLRCLSLVPRFCWAGWESCQLDCVGRGGITVLNLYQGYCVLSRKLSFYFWLLPCSFSFSHQFHLVFFTYSVLFFPPYCFPWSNSLSSLWPYLFDTDQNNQAMNFENKVKQPCGSEFLFHQVWLSDYDLHFQSLFQAPLERPCPLYWFH